MEKRTKTLLLSVIALCVCTALAVGTTFALFSAKKTVNNHLSAGNLDIGLYRISYEECVVNDKGLLEERDANDNPTFDDRINLVTNNAPIFTVSKAAPATWYEATLEVSNTGSTAFDYGVRILWTDTTDENAEDYCEKDEVLAKQIRITITSDKISRTVTDENGNPVNDESGNPIKVNYVTFMLDQCSLEENKISLGYLLVGDDAETFTVKAEFVNDEVVDGIVNNDAMSSELKFDVQVYATQKVSLD